MKVKNVAAKAGKVNIENIKSDFVSLASHQLRTPLSAIKWNTEILLNRKTGKLTPRQRKHLKDIYRSNERSISLVNDLLDVSRIQTGGIHLELRPIRVEDVVEEVFDNFDTLIRTSEVRINFEIINGPLPKFEADQEKLKRVLVNLLSNAIKYTPRLGKVRVTIEKMSRFLKIGVSDSGVGIPKSEQNKIFQKFFRATNVIKLVPEGTGLGLFIAKSLVEAMGGKISFSSEETKGTSFYFTLPIKGL